MLLTLKIIDTYLFLIATIIKKSVPLIKDIHQFFYNMLQLNQALSFQFQ